MLKDSSDAARADEGDARFAKRKPSSSSMEIVPRHSHDGSSVSGVRKVSDVTVAAMVLAEVTKSKQRRWR